MHPHTFCRIKAGADGGGLGPCPSRLSALPGMQGYLDNERCAATEGKRERFDNVPPMNNIDKMVEPIDPVMPISEGA